MEGLTFEEIIRLINYSRTTEITSKPYAGRSDGWALYRGKHKVRSSSYPFSVLYLPSRATRRDIEEANLVWPDGEVHIVYTPTLKQRQTITASQFKSCSTLQTTKEYLASFIVDETKIYLQKLSEQRPAHYIDPRIETPSGFPRKIPNPLQSFLTDREIRGLNGEEGALAILLAEPGQGKTYMSRYLASYLTRFRDKLVPILVDSTQWHDMSLDDLSSLNKTILNSFRHYGASIGWVENHEKEFLRTTLKGDLFRIVFDGFDEYILRNRGSFQAMEVLEALSQLARDTASRIIITSRTSFWHSNITGDEAKSFIGEHGAWIYTILPFDLEHAKNYFRQRFDNKPKLAERAIGVFAALNKGNEELVGRGFVLNLIADFVEAVPTGPISQAVGSAGLVKLMEQFCERDVLRQQLPLNSAQQMKVFRLIATESARGTKPTSDLLQVCVSETAPHLTPQDQELCLERLRPHPLLRYEAKSDTWRFKEPQITNALLADQIVHWPQAEVTDFIRKIHLEPDSLQDLGEMIVDLTVCDCPDPSSSVGELASIVSALCLGEGKRLASAVVLMAIERLLPHGSSHQERTGLLLALCGKPEVHDLDFSGTIARFEFANVRFVNCLFENVSWANCHFSKETVFERCSFRAGVLAGRVEGFGSVTLNNCSLDQSASQCFNAAQVTEGHRNYALEDLQGDLKALITKFVTKGGVALRTVSRQHLPKGAISNSRHKDEIISAFTSSILADHHISGTAESGYHVRSSAEEAVRFHAANNVFTGPLRELYENLQKKLIK